MSERERRDLEDPDNWDFENAEEALPIKSPRAVVSVSFPRADFETVVRAARAAGERTSEFIRAAALQRAQNRGHIVRFQVRGTGYAAFGTSTELEQGTRTATNVVRHVIVEAS